MKRIPFILVIISIILIGILGCSENVDLVFSKVNTKTTNKKVKTFMERYNDMNGIYLYVHSSNDMYLYLNGYNVNNGDKASYFTDVKVEVKEGTLVINFNEKYIDDYHNKEIDNRVLYKIRQPKKVDTITIFKNGQETHFDTIGV
jgi:hypothetical protein